MAYKSEDMRLMGGVPGQQLFMYRSGDASGEVAAVGYFDAAAEEYNLETGDVIIACTGADSVVNVEILVATNVSGSVNVNGVAS